MLLPTTENLPGHEAVDSVTPVMAATLMLDGQQAALAAVRTAIPQIAQAADIMASAIRSRNTLIYAAAGSSGLMALADACELPGTFGIPTNSIRIHMAGGIPADGHMPGHTEDDPGAAKDVVQDAKAGDAFVILSASGTTPYAVAVAEAARSIGASVIGIANNPGTSLLDLADVPICLATPPEVIAGSTRLGAGTAQKAALNLMSSLMGIGLGHVHHGMMVNVVADNAKLINRAKGIVARIANVPEDKAVAALNRTDGHVKAAILVAAGHTPSAAEELLTTHGGHLAPCLPPLATPANT